MRGPLVLGLASFMVGWAVTIGLQDAERRSLVIGFLDLQVGNDASLSLLEELREVWAPARQPFELCEFWSQHRA